MSEITYDIRLCEQMLREAGIPMATLTSSELRALNRGDVETIRKLAEKGPRPGHDGDPVPVPEPATANPVQEVVLKLRVIVEVEQR